MSRFKGWTGEDVWFLIGVSCGLVIVLAVGIFAVGLAVSRLGCEFFPTSERCVVLHERGSSW